MGNAFLGISSRPSLKRAWLYISDKTPKQHRNGSGWDGVSINTFASRADEEIQMLSHRIRSWSSYPFDPLKAFVETKQNGGVRVICVPSVRDRVLQRSLLDFLIQQPRHSFNNSVSYGFIRGKTVEAAATKAIELRRNSRWVYKTDISAFFDRIDRGLLEGVIRQKIRFPSLHPLLINAVKCEIKPKNIAQRRKLKESKIVKGLGVRQGMPLSPYFANMFLEDFDRAVIQKNLNMVRYADDLIFFCDSKSECEEVHGFCISELVKLGLTIPDMSTKKTRIYSENETADFLGVGIESTGNDYRLVITRSQIEKKLSELYQHKKLQYLEENKITISKLMRQLTSKIEGWLGAYSHCANLNEFDTALFKAKKEILEYLFINELGISSLTNTKRAFLEIASEET